MRVCMILEGSYPFVNGGVSSWTHQYIRGMRDVDFVLWCIGAKEESRDRFVYELPENVVEVHQLFLDEALKSRGKRGKRRKFHLTEEEMRQLEAIERGQEVDWQILFAMCRKKNFSPEALLKSWQFLDILKNLCRTAYPFLSFAEFFHTMRSMLLPELYLLAAEVPQADVYHATATGYSGLLGSLAAWMTKRPFIVTEHGIYTREREEELLRAKWVDGRFRKQWIQLFYAFSKCAYQYAKAVTALFPRASKIQQELGCPAGKTRVIANGIHYEDFERIPAKQEDGWIHIGAVVRIARIKDIKTMLYAFLELKQWVPKARLYIMGGVDDQEYLEECKTVIGINSIEDVIFTGLVDVKAYLEKLDFTILSSISEGQPLSILESFAAGRPVVTTEVGCCRELIEGNEEDGFGAAGFCVPPMHKERFARAMKALCENAGLRKQMGEAGRRRVKQYYTHEQSIQLYRELYQEVETKWQESGLN